MRNRYTLMAIVLVPRPEGLRPVRLRSPLNAAISLGTAGIVTTLLFGLFTSVVPTGSLFARELTTAPRSVASHAVPAANRVGAAVVLPTVRVTASN